MPEITNYEVYVFCAGCVCMAFIYHSVLYLIQRNKLLLYYSAYLFAASLYLVEKTMMSKVYHDDSSTENFLYNLFDEPIQMLIYFTYLQFASRAVDIYTTGDKRLLALFNLVMWVIPIYIIAHLAAIYFHLLHHRHVVAFIGIRVMLIGSFVFLLLWFAKFVKDKFVKFIITGSLVMFIGNLLAFISSITQREILGIYGVMWTYIALVLDVLCFSAALGYKVRKDNEEKQLAMQQLLIKEKELQQEQINNLENIYRTRDAERNRIARDLHDEIGSTLSSIYIYSTVAKKSIETDRDKTKQALEQINTNTRMVMDNMSDIVWSMKTNESRNTLLSNKIKDLGYELLAAANINGQYEIAPAADNAELDIDLRRNILLIVKESLNNICKYSHATAASVKISIANQMLEVLIADNGTGFDAQAIHNGNGLQNIQFRVKKCGGEVNIISSLNTGTKISCHFPLTTFSE